MHTPYRWLAVPVALALALVASLYLPTPSDARPIGGLPIITQESTAGGTGRIAFSSDRTDKKAQIFIMNADGTEPVQITQGPDEHLWPVWRPDGGLMASICLTAPDTHNVCTFDAAGTHQKLLTRSGQAGFPSWSPDGRRIAYADGFDSKSANLTGDVYAMDADGQNVTRLTQSGLNGFPAWSPDGKQIAYASADGGVAAIWVMNADGSQPRKLTAGRPQDFAPAWSPDGRRIAFFSSLDLSQLAGNIYAMDADGSDIVQLTRTGKAALPAWSPDGLRIAFTVKTDDHSVIDVMDADGTNVMTLTHDQATDATAAWEPIAAAAPGGTPPGSTRSQPPAN